MKAGQTAVEKGREIAAFAKAGPHRQGEAYAGAVFFFVSGVPDDLGEGVELLKWAMLEARKSGGFGHHIVPVESMAVAQVQAIEKHIRRIPSALKRLMTLLMGVNLLEGDGTKRFLEPLLRQVFLDALTAGDQPNEGSLREKANDAKTLASYFILLEDQTLRAIRMG